MDNLLYLYVGITGNIISVLMFLSPMKTFWRIVEKGSTEEFKSLPYICTLLNSCLWTYYGIINPGSYLVATVNGFGILVEIVYISLFLIYAPPKIRGKTLKEWKLDEHPGTLSSDPFIWTAKTAMVAGIVDVVVFTGTVLVTQFGIMEGDMRIDVIGFMGAALNIIMYASPLSAMRFVVTTKSVEYMPFLLSLFFFLNGGVWTFYAVLVRDWFLGVPNGTGFVLGIAQLALYSVYRESKPLKSISDDLEGRGQQHQHLLPSSTSNHTEPGANQL